MVRAEFILKVGALGLLAALGGSGCGGAEKPAEPPAAVSQLTTIGRAYAQATTSLDRGPRNKGELMPFLKNLADPEKPGDPADMLRSATDGEEFVIHWGADFRSENVSFSSAKLPVLAYEKHGKDGKRLVLQVRYVREVTDEELNGLRFPRGYRAP